MAVAAGIDLYGGHPGLDGLIGVNRYRSRIALHNANSGICSEYLDGFQDGAGFPCAGRSLASIIFSRTNAFWGISISSDMEKLG